MLKNHSMRILMLCTALILIFALSACQNSEPLPDHIEEVGSDVLVKSDDVLDATDIMPNSTESESASDPGEELTADDTGVEYASAETIKEWVAAYVSGDYSDASNDEGTQSGIMRETASLASGGTISILSMYVDENEGHVYYMTELAFDVQTSEDTLTTDISGVMSAYLSRQLTGDESEGIAETVHAAMLSDTLIYAEALDNAATVYMLREDEHLLVQIR